MKCGDWLAADRVAVELMGIDFAKVGYLNDCTEARLGEGDLTQLSVLICVALTVRPKLFFLRQAVRSA